MSKRDRALIIAKRAKEDAAAELDRTELVVARAQCALTAARADRAKARARHQATIMAYLDLVEGTASHA